MILLDSSVIIAAFRKEEDHHRDALDIFRHNTSFLLLDHVLFEVGTVLKMREGQLISQRCLDFLLNTEGIDFVRATDEEIQKSLLEFQEEENKKLSFVDTLLLVLHRTRNISLATFDKDLQKKLS